jgi:hypothetical protein
MVDIFRSVVEIRQKVGSYGEMRDRMKPYWAQGSRLETRSSAQNEVRSSRVSVTQMLLQTERRKCCRYGNL